MNKSVSITFSENGGFIINATSYAIIDASGSIIGGRATTTKTYTANSVDEVMAIVRERMDELQAA